MPTEPPPYTCSLCDKKHRERPYFCNDCARIMWGYQPKPETKK